MKIKEKWVAWEELLPGFTPATTIDFQQVGGLAPGSIPFADATGFLTQDNANFFWDAANARLGLNQTTPTARIDIVAEANFPGINIEAGAAGEMSTPDGQQFRWGHWDRVNTFTERLKFDAAGIFYISYLTTGSVIFAGAGGEIKQDNANFSWDDANKRLRVGEITIIDGKGLNLEEDISFTGANGVNLILFPDDLAAALQIREGANAYISFRTTDGNESIDVYKPLKCRAIIIDNGYGLSLQEDITFTGATAQNLIKFPDNLPTALDFREAGNSYLKFVSTNGSEAVVFSVEVDMTGVAACIDLNPAGTGSKDIISIIPTASLVEDSTWHGVYIDANALDPATGDPCTIHGFHFDATGLASIDHDGNIVGFVTTAPVQDSFTGFSATLRALTENKTQNSFIAFGGNTALDDTATYNGLFVDWDNIIRTGGVPVLHGVHVLLPGDYSGFGVSYAGYFLGDGRSVTLCDTTYALDVSGTSRITGTLSAVEITDLATTATNVAAGTTGQRPAGVVGDIRYNSTLGLFEIYTGAWASIIAGGGDVTAAAVIADHAIVRGDGGAKGVQDSGVIIDDADNVTGMVTLTLPNEGLHILDTNASHDLIIKAGSDLTADRIFTLMTGDAAKTLTIMGDCTIDNWFDQSVKQAASPTFAAVSLGQEGLQLLDTGDDNFLIFKSAEDLGANRILSIVMGDAARTITFSGNPTLADWFDQAVKAASNVSFGTIGCGTITVADGSSINLQEDITFLGATTENLIKFPDNLPDAFSFMEGVNPYQTFITDNGNEAIQFHEDVLLKGSTEYGAGNKTTANWNKSIGSGGDYADWVTMIAAMPDLIAHAVTVTIEAGTTLTEICEILNKHGITSVGEITIQAEKYYPTASAIPTADSATATTLRDAELATAALGNDYFNDCWILIVHGTGTDNGYVLITDYIDATGDVVVANWPGTRPDNTSRYIIVGALIDGAGARSIGLSIANCTAKITMKGIGVKDVTIYGMLANYCSSLAFHYCGAESCGMAGLYIIRTFEAFVYRSGFVGNNTTDNVAGAGARGDGTNFLYITQCALSDNLRQGIWGQYGGFIFSYNNFGDANGAWGTYVKYATQARMLGTECSGAGGNHSDPGTAGNANADQAAVY